VATDKVELEFIADTSGVEQGFNKVDSGLKGLDGSVQRASSSVSSFFSVFAGSLAAGGVAGAIGEIVNAFSQLPEIIGRGAQIDDIAASFDDLATKAGVAGDSLINGFSKALGDTIPKVDLMKQANELLNGGIDPTKFNDLAGAARSLAEVTGGSAKDGLDQLSDALLRGRTMGLKAIGVIVDNGAAVEKYAKSIGVTTQALSEEDKIEAIRIATLDALAKKRGELAAVEDDAADKIDQMRAGLQNQTDEVLRSIANNKDLNDVLDKLATAVSSLQFGPLANDLFTIASAMGSFTVSVIESAAKLAQYVPIVKQVGDSLSALRDIVAKGAFLINFFNTDGEKNQALVLNGVLKEMGINFKSAGAAAGQLNNQLSQTAEAQAKASAAAEANVKRIRDAQAALTGEKKALEDKKKAEQDAAEAVRKAEAEEKKRNEQLLQASNAIAKLTIESDKYKAILDQLKTGTIDNATAGQKIAALYSDTKRAVDDLASSEQILNSLLYAQSQGANIAAKDIADWAEKVRDGKAAVDGLSKAAQGGGSFLDLLVGKGLDPGQSQVATAIGSALSTAITEAVNSGDVVSAIKNAGSSMGQALGSAAGASLGPIGAAVGGSIGQALADRFIKGTENIGKSSQGTGKGLKTIIDSIFPGVGSGIDALLGDKLFGGDSEGTQTRKQIDKFFADAFDAQRLLVIINGQLAQIKDLDLGGGLFGSSSSSAGQFFQGLSGEAQNAFSAIAAGFTQMLGGGSDAAVGLAQAFAENLGGSLNNLQLLVEATGVSFEDLKKGTVEAFLDGKLSALEAQSALQGIQQIAEKGIPGSLGDVSQAFDNMKAAGTKGGRALIDGLQDIGFEAKKLGQKDLTQVVASLAATGKYSSAEIQQVFDALKAAGITTVDQLTKATTEQLLPVLAQLENTKFPFAEQVKDVRDYIDAVDKIPASKDVQINVKVKYDSEANQRVVQDLSSGARPGQQGTAQV